MGTPMIAAYRGVPVPLERSRRGGLRAANANDEHSAAQQAATAAPQAGLPPDDDTGAYRLPGLHEGHGLSWPALSGALLLHGALALAVIGIAWTSHAPVPLPATIAVVFEQPPPAPQVAQPEVKAPSPPPAAAPAPVEEPPAPPAAPALAVPSPPPAVETAKAATVVLPLPPPPRPQVREAAVQPPRQSAAPPSPPEPVHVAPMHAAPTMAVTRPPAPSAAPPATVAALPVIPPRPASGVAGNRKPVYPLAARSRHLQGRVVLEVDVSAAGDAMSVHIVSSSGHSLLDESALQAVRSWHFVPASRAGQPVAGTVDVPVDFRMAD